MLGNLFMLFAVRWLLHAAKLYPGRCGGRTSSESADKPYRLAGSAAAGAALGDHDQDHDHEGEAAAPAAAASASKQPASGAFDKTPYIRTLLALYLYSFTSISNVTFKVCSLPECVRPCRLILALLGWI
jgi:hypothetical protein